MLVNSRCFPDEVIFNTHLADVCVRHLGSVITTSLTFITNQTV